MKRAGVLISLWLLAGPALAQEAPFRLGVQTHFEQGWSPALIDRAADLGARLLRDEIAWADAETAPGQYDFARADVYMQAIAARGLQVQIVTLDGHPAHDRGQTPHTAAGRAAYADFLAAMLARYSGTIHQLELGNEVNSREFLHGPFAADPARAFARMAGTLTARLGPAADRPPIVCTGVNTLALGFLRDTFRHGTLDHCDAISVHPYREHPETLDLELARLRALMREMGGEKPVVVTEFGKWVEDPAQSPAHMLKMVAIMGAAEVQDAYWYALMDEPWWPNMGLLATDGQEKPAAAAFRLLQDRLLPLGRPQGRSTTRTARIYEFGTGGRAFVVWGAGGVLRIGGPAEFLDATGQPVPRPDRLGDDPVVVLGTGLDLRVDQTPPVADAMYQFGTPPWSYFARRPGLGLTPLEIIDGQWGSYRGAPDLDPLRITDDWITTARFADGPFHAVERFTATDAGHHRVTGQWQAAPGAEPSRIEIRHNGALVAQGQTGPHPFAVTALDLTLAAGDRLEFEAAPAGPNGDGALRRRIRIVGPLP